MEKTADQNIKDFLGYSQMVIDTIWKECGIDDKKMTKKLIGKMPLKEKALISIYSEFVKYYNEKTEQTKKLSERVKELEAELLELREAVLKFIQQNNRKEMYGIVELINKIGIINIDGHLQLKKEGSTE